MGPAGLAGFSGKGLTTLSSGRGCGCFLSTLGASGFRTVVLDGGGGFFGFSSGSCLGDALIEPLDVSVFLLSLNCTSALGGSISFPDNEDSYGIHQ